MTQETGTKSGKRRKKVKPGSKPEPPKEARKVESDVDFETLVRDEYQKLQRRYRVLRDARHSIAGDTGRLSKAVSVFRRWEDEKIDLLIDLENAACFRNKEVDKRTIRSILDILELYEFRKSQLEKAYSDIAEMEENVDKITKRLVDQKLKVQKLYGMSLTRSKVDNWIAKLENRLYHVTTQFDSCVTKNKVLHNDIDAMLQIRGKFFRRALAVRKISGDIKHRMGGVVFEATQAYEQRDDWVSKTALLRERNDKDSRQHVLEIKELQRVLHHDSKNHEFLEFKNRERLLLESVKERHLRKNAGKIALLDETLENYKRSFNAILKRSTNKDIDSLVFAYLHQEEENFAVLKYVTDLSHENNSCREDIHNIKKEIEDQYAERDRTTVAQARVLENLEKTLKKEKDSLKDTMNNYKSADQLMDEFGNILNQAFNSADCSNNGIIALLGNQSGIKPQNICLCLSVLEHRVSELLFEKGRLEIQKAVEIDGLPLPKRPQLWLPGVKPKPQGGPFKPKHVVTGRMDAEQEEEEQNDSHLSSKPVYYKDLHEQLMPKMELQAKSMAVISHIGLNDEFQPSMEASFMNVTDDYSRKPLAGPGQATGNPSTMNKPA